MSGSEWFDPIVITWDGDERSTVQNSFDLCKDCSELFECEFHVRDDAPEMSFMLFTADSHNPPKFGARSGMNFQEMP